MIKLIWYDPFTAGHTHGCVLSTVFTDALVVQHKAITIHSADEISIVLDQFYIMFYIIGNNLRK